MFTCTFKRTFIFYVFLYSHVFYTFSHILGVFVHIFYIFASARECVFIFMHKYICTYMHIYDSSLDCKLFSFCVYFVKFSELCLCIGIYTCSFMVLHALIYVVGLLFYTSLTIGPICLYIYVYLYACLFLILYTLFSAVMFTF